MAQDVNELVKEIISNLTENCKKHEYSFVEPLGCTATKLTRITREVVKQLESLIKAGDIVVEDEPLRSIYLAEGIDLQILSVLPLIYPEMVEGSELKIFHVYQLPSRKSIGSMVYDGPAKSDPDRGTIGIGYRINFIFNVPVQYLTFDIQVNKESSNE